MECEIWEKFLGLVLELRVKDSKFSVFVSAESCQYPWGYFIDLFCLCRVRNLESHAQTSSSCSYSGFEDLGSQNLPSRMDFVNSYSFHKLGENGLLISECNQIKSNASVALLSKCWRSAFLVSWVLQNGALSQLHNSSHTRCEEGH